MIVNDISKVNLIDKFGNSISKKKILNDYKNINEITNNNGSKKLVFLLIENNYESIIFYISLLKSQNTIVLVNSKITVNYLYKLIELYKPNTIITKQSIEIKDYKEIYKLLNYNCYERSKKTI